MARTMLASPQHKRPAQFPLVFRKQFLCLGQVVLPQVSIWREKTAKTLTIPACYSVSFASYAKSFQKSDLCKKITPKATDSKKKKDLNGQIAVLSNFRLFFRETS